MITYICKYAPIEILEACGTPVIIMEPHVTNFTQADVLMHPNMCSFVKAVLEDFENGDYEGMLLTTCCDSSRRLYDALKRKHPEKFFYLMDLPRKVNDFSASLYASQIWDLIEQYEAFSGKTFRAEMLVDMCRREFEMQKRKQELIAANRISTEKSDLNICLAGARPGSAIKRLINAHGAKIALDLTCTGISREFEIDDSDILISYAKSLLGQIPCMRMGDATERADKLRESAAELDGIIYHTVKFCDIYSYEYTAIKKADPLPMVKLETDATTQCEGQILTRLEAFLESLRARRKSGPNVSNTPYLGEAHIAAANGQTTAADARCTACCDSGRSNKERLTISDLKADSAAGTLIMENKGNETMYILGIDSGSTSTNAVIINEKKEIIASAVVRTGAKSGESADRVLKEVLEQANLKREDLSLIVSTGYGRVSIPFADRNVTEISCHAKGAHFLNPSIRTILDIGGQDSKAIRLNENGDVVDFVMNDKCAAGTGRFLEMMARTLEIGIDELGPISLQAKESINISSMCSVFAESEVISLIAQNKETADIARGIHRAIAGKAISLMKRVGMEPEYMMTGGVAKNPGVVKVLEEQLKAPLFLYDEPEIVGALGAALYGLE